MNISKKNLELAVAENIISAQQAHALYDFLQTQNQHAPRFNFTNILYYLDGLVAVGAMSIFMNLGREHFGGAGIFFISLLYAGIGFLLSNSFAAKNQAIPAGVCATFVVCLTPLAIYGLQRWLGFWPDESLYKDYHRLIKWHWLYMELGTLAVGAIVAWRYKYPLLIMPIAVTLWYMSMDIAAMIAGEELTWELRRMVSMYVGLLMIGLAFWIDLRSHKKGDYAFWMYILGVLAFWGGLSFQDSNSEWSKFLYFCINFIMLGVGVLLVRRVFVVFGAIGMCDYIGHLAYSVFKDSWLFPISLSVVGLGIVYLGLLWQKHEQAITEKSRSLLPAPLRDLLESKS